MLNTNPIPFIDLQAQYRAYKDEIDSAISDVVRDARFILGPTVSDLEAELAVYVGTKHCVACSSGTDALVISLMALGIGRGDEVIVPAFSFFATAEAVSLVGATPVFVDIDIATYAIDPQLVEGAVTHATRAIIPVGLYGQPADMDAITAVAQPAGIVVVEDAAQSLGGTYNGRQSGSLAEIGCTSFYPAKPLGCYGDGGAVFTSDDELASRMRQIMNHGQSAGYRHETIGINGRLDALQAAILRVKLRRFEEELDSRASVAAGYDNSFVDLSGIELPHVAAGRTSSYAQYTLRVTDRDSFRAYLGNHGIPTAVHYPTTLFRQPAYADLGAERIEKYANACPNAERAATEVVSLPFGPFLTKHQQERVVGAVRAFVERSGV